MQKSLRRIILNVYDMISKCTSLFFFKVKHVHISHVIEFLNTYTSYRNIILWN